MILAAVQGGGFSLMCWDFSKYHEYIYKYIYIMKLHKGRMYQQTLMCWDFSKYSENIYIYYEIT